MNEKTEATISILAALFVLFSAMLDPRVSVVLSVIFLVAFAVYKFTRPARQISLLKCDDKVEIMVNSGAGNVEVNTN
jgi:hypothetical protein